MKRGTKTLVLCIVGVMSLLPRYDLVPKKRFVLGTLGQTLKILEVGPMMDQFRPQKTAIMTSSAVLFIL